MTCSTLEVPNKCIDPIPCTYVYIVDICTYMLCFMLLCVHIYKACILLLTRHVSSSSHDICTYMLASCYVVYIFIHRYTHTCVNLHLIALAYILHQHPNLNPKLNHKPHSPSMHTTSNSHESEYFSSFVPERARTLTFKRACSV